MHYRQPRPKADDSQPRARPSTRIINLPNVRVELAVEHVAAHRHLELIEGVLHDVVGVEIVDFAHGDVDVGLHGVGEKQELCARLRVEALQPEILRLHDLEPRGGLRPAGEGPSLPASARAAAASEAAAGLVLMLLLGVVVGGLVLP